MSRLEELLYVYYVEYSTVRMRWPRAGCRGIQQRACLFLSSVTWLAPGHRGVGQIPSSDTSFRKVAVTLRN